MREGAVSRRTLFAVAAGFGICGWAIGSAEARQHAAGARQPRPKPRSVALDPGHGGVDPGAIGPNGLYEKTVTLAIARDLARRLDASGRYRTLLTRSRDTFVPLRERVARARGSRAELFLSIHVDALPDRDLRGLSVYTLSERASDRETAALAARENKDDFVAGVRLSRQPPVVGAILLDLTRRQTNNQSLVLARNIVEELGRTVPLLDKPHREAGFTVLTAPDIPSALVELGCLSNPAEERLLGQHGYQRRLAEALAHAIDDFFARAVPA
jgi:N-acetylmuramoyl-L-alanine amidase